MSNQKDTNPKISHKDNLKKNRLKKLEDKMKQNLKKRKKNSK
jgi:hypothetical protein|tara:strand:+ start:40 stop:165 length:126 start_codon:yes stop_codon:yes gene_type:complete